MAEACTFKAPNAGKPLGCACDPRPNSFAYCKFDACDFAGCRAGFFDLDGQASNGCEADRSMLPGNLVFEIEPRQHSFWNSELDTYQFDVKEGIATATAADPMCQPNAFLDCSVRLEAFQVSFDAAMSLATQAEKFEDAVVMTTVPFGESESSNGIDLPPSIFSASFGKDGDRAPLLDIAGMISVLIFPSSDGTVRLSLHGTLKGYLSDRKGVFNLSIRGKTPKLFDASPPDARPKDSSTDHDSAPSEDASDDGGDSQ
jgi:hypothetical protein